MTGQEVLAPATDPLTRATPVTVVIAAHAHASFFQNRRTLTLCSFCSRIGPTCRLPPRETGTGLRQP